MVCKIGKSKILLRYEFCYNGRKNDWRPETLHNQIISVCNYLNTVKNTYSVYYQKFQHFYNVIFLHQT